MGASSQLSEATQLHSLSHLSITEPDRRFPRYSARVLLIGNGSYENAQMYIS